MNTEKSDEHKTEKKQQVNAIQKKSNEDIDRLEEEAEKNRTRKPGSQSNSSDRHNNGRGGGK